MAVELQSKDILIQQKDLKIAKKYAEIEQLRYASSINFCDSYYRPSMDKLNASYLRFSGNYGLAEFASSSGPSYPSVNYEFAQSTSFSRLNTQSSWHVFDQL